MKPLEPDFGEVREVSRASPRNASLCSCFWPLLLGVYQAPHPIPCADFSLVPGPSWTASALTHHWVVLRGAWEGPSPPA